ncbi:amino acid permease [Streptomyces kaempferi]
MVNSAIANANACATVSTRTAFALGRIKVFPELFARLHPRHRSPVAGVAVQCAVAIAAMLGLGFAYDPVTAFLLLATVIVTVVIGVYIVVNLACAGYFLRRRRELFRPVRHLLFPLLGIVAFVPALLTAAGLPVFDFVSELTAPVSYAGPVVGVWMMTGVVVLIVLSRGTPGA